jgi:CheY-like chemotaxis protein
MARVLVADDDARLLELQARLLEAGGHQVLVAFNASEVIRQLGEAEVVIMDLRFPNAQGLSDAAEGLKLIRRIRESGCRAPLIVMSGWPEDLRNTSEARFVSQVLTKPVKMTDLLQAISAVCAPSRNLPSAGR